MDKLKMHSPDMTQENIKKIIELFPNCKTEARDENGQLRFAIDFDQLKQELSDSIVEGPQERYHLNWPGKREALLQGNTPTQSTLLPIFSESVNFETTENIFIEGDNLEVLKLLQESYLSKVKLIYIDPPYNTGKDFIYKDSFASESKEYMLDSNQVDPMGRKLVANTEANGRFHSDWLSMIYPRLKLARNLLRDDGVIFVSIDDHESENLKKICDEVFGQPNFITTLVWNKQHSQQQGLFKRYHEYIHVYAKNVQLHSNIIGGEGEIVAGALKKISNANPASDFTFPAGVRCEAPDGTSFTGIYGDSEKVTVVSGDFLIEGGKTKSEITLSAGWTQKNQMEQWFKGEDVYDSKGQRVLEFYFSATGKLKCRKERTTITPSTLLPKYGMSSKQSKELGKLIEVDAFDNPKPVMMLRDFIKWFTTGSDIVMDFFAGSSTTAHAVIDQNIEDGYSRKFIMVQLPEECPEGSPAAIAGYKNIAEISRKRIVELGKLVGKTAPEKTSEIDLGFRTFKVDSSNISDNYAEANQITQQALGFATQTIKANRKTQDVLFEVLIDLGIELSLPLKVESISGFEVFIVDHNNLVGCFELNLTEDFFAELAKLSPLRIVCRDDAFKNDSMKVNCEQLVKQLSPQTELKTI